MDISPSNFVSVDIILADVLDLVDDGGMKMKSKGWYTSQIQQALEELSFDTFFLKQNQSFPVPSNLRLEMPKGSFNLRNIYLFNGSDCVIGKAANVYRKTNFINSKSGKGYVAEDTWENSGDHIHMNRSTGRNPHNQGSANPPSNVHFYGVQNGVIMLSESCLNYQNIMLEFNGVMTDIGEVPFIPQFFRQAVKDWVSVEALKIRRNKSRGTSDATYWNTVLNETKAKLNDIYDGSWVKAERRAKRLNNKDRRDLKEYMTSLNF